MIPYGRQDITEEDIQSVVDVLKSDWLTQGPTVPQFETELAQKVGACHAIAVNSATSALHLSCLALGLKPGDWLWTSPITFVASANSALYCGANVDFVDIDPKTYNLSVDALSTKLEQAKKDGKLPKIVMPVHYAGQSCDMGRISELSKQYGFKIIEDASHAIGADYQNRHVGSCQYSDVTVFSFHPVKIITSGEGGVVTTNDKALYEKICSLRSHGVTREANLFHGEAHGAWYYEQQDLGFNYRMTDIHAALGLSQLQRLEHIVRVRNKIAKIYNEALSNLPLTLPHVKKENYSSFHLYPIQIDTSKTAISRKKLFDSLRQDGIGVNVHYIPVHTQPYYKNMGFETGQFPIAESFYSRVISLPIHTKLTDEEQEKIITSLSRILHA